MTTPAIDINVSRSSPAIAESYDRFGNLLGKFVLTTRISGGEIHRRPESVSHPIDKATGWREPTNWFHYRCEQTNPPRGYAKKTYPDGSYLLEVDGCGMSNAPSLPSTALDLNLENRALINALTKLKNQSFNTGIFVGEGRETLSMLGQSLYRIYSGIKAFKHLNPDLWKKVKKVQVGGLAKKHWREIPQAWLELQYGWIPLMSDLSGACKALANMAQKTEPRVTVSGFARDKISVSERIIAAGTSGCYCDVVKTTEAFCKVVLTYTPQDASTIMKTSLGLANPLEIVWEVLPWSFVADWFYTIGPWLGAIDADKGYNFKSGIRSIKRESVEKIVGYGTLGLNNEVLSNLVPATYKSSSFDRTVYNSSPVPGPYVKGPLSVGHTVNLLALLAVTIRD